MNKQPKILIIPLIQGITFFFHLIESVYPRFSGRLNQVGRPFRSLVYLEDFYGDNIFVPILVNCMLLIMAPFDIFFPDLCVCVC